MSTFDIEHKESQDEFNIWTPLKCVNIQCPKCLKRFDNTVGMTACIAYPCEHMFHETIACKGIVGRNCEICNTKIDAFLRKDDLDKLDQRYVDQASVVRNKQKFSKWRKFIGILKTIRTIPLVCGLSSRTFLDHIGIPLYCSPDRNWINKKYLDKLNIKVLNLLNVTVTIEGEEKLLDQSKCIVICNHTNYHDMLAVASKYTEMGFMASPSINNFALGRAVTKKYPHVMVENDTTSKIKDIDVKRYSELKKLGGFDASVKFMNEHNKLMICPEGMLTSYDSIVNFRSTAFKVANTVGCQIQPILITYNYNIYDLVGFDLMCAEPIKAHILVMDRITTDGSSESIESIRKSMADIGNLKLSRIENRSIKKTFNLFKS